MELDRSAMGSVATRSSEPEVSDMQYDYVVVGGGSAGCVVACRLSENPAVSVLLIEAGGSNQDWKVRAPFFGCARLVHSDRDWQIETEEQRMTQRRSRCPRGKLLGGCSSINTMVWVRGDPRTFDYWESRLGCTGWGWQDVLPFFKKCETFNGPTHLRGSDGPIQVSDARRGELATQPVCQKFLEACSQCGIPATIDYNGAQQEGAATTQGNVKDGVRYDAATAYLFKTGAVSRPNLRILTGSRATRLLLEGKATKRASGVIFQRGGTCACARARSEVVLCCGAIATPQLLMLSGIGPKAHLEEMGIDCKVDLPVGQNLQDHLMWEMKFPARRPMDFNPSQPFSAGFLKSCELSLAECS